MSSYFHEFVPGFNWWYVTTFATLAIMGVIGWIIPRTKRDQKGNLRLRVIFKKRFGYILSVPFTLLWSAMLIIESHRGIIQWFDNRLGYSDSEIWSIVFTGGTIVALTIAMGLACVAAYSIGRAHKIKNLCQKYGLANN